MNRNAKRLQWLGLQWLGLLIGWLVVLGPDGRAAGDGGSLVAAQDARGQEVRAEESGAEAASLRVGIIGLDTSHVPAFTKIFNAPDGTGDGVRLRVVAGYPGGTDFPPSRDRVAGFTQQMRDMGVEIVDSIEDLLARVDVVLLESVDGRVHLEQVLPVFQAGKPVFIDKPLAGSLADAIAIVELSRRYEVPFFSCSSYRFTPAVVELLDHPQVGAIQGAATWGPCTYQEGTPDLYFYGVHGVEALYTLMGPGCQTVTRVKTPDTDLVTGHWEGGRIGTYRGIRNHASTFGALVFGAQGIVQSGRAGGYEPLCAEIAKFFHSRVPPVSADETLEMFAFMEAADESVRRGGAPVALAEVLELARKQATERIAERLPEVPRP